MNTQSSSSIAGAAVAALSVAACSKPADKSADAAATSADAAADLRRRFAERRDRRHRSRPRRHDGHSCRRRRPPTLPPTPRR